MGGGWASPASVLTLQKELWVCSMGSWKWLLAAGNQRPLRGNLFISPLWLLSFPCHCSLLLQCFARFLPRCQDPIQRADCPSWTFFLFCLPLWFFYEFVSEIQAAALPRNTSSSISNWRPLGNVCSRFNCLTNLSRNLSRKLDTLFKIKSPKFVDGQNL